MKYPKTFDYIEYHQKIVKMLTIYAARFDSPGKDPFEDKAIITCTTDCPSGKNKKDRQWYVDWNTWQGIKEARKEVHYPYHLDMISAIIKAHPGHGKRMLGLTERTGFYTISIAGDGMAWICHACRKSYCYQRLFWIVKKYFYFAYSYFRLGMDH